MTRNTAQKGGKRPGLDREGVVRAAAELVNREGPPALTIHRLARELRVQPPSLYNHIGGLEELWRELALLNLRGIGDALTRAAMGRSGEDGVMALAQAYRGYVLRNPGLYMASLRSSGNLDMPDPVMAEAEEQAVRPTLALVESLGLKGEDAIHYVRALRSAIHGFASLESASGFGLPLDLNESFERMIRTILRGIRADSET